MSIIDVDYYELDRQIDERIEEFCRISNNYGDEIMSCDNPDGDSRLVSSEVFDLQDNQLLSIIQGQQEQIDELREVILANASMTLAMADKLDMKPEEDV